jgi:hypothetical protein
MFWLLAVYPLLWASAMFFQVAHAIGKVGAFYVCDVVVQLVTLLALFYTVGHLSLGAPGAAMSIGLVGGLLHIFLIWPMGLRLVNGRWDLFVRQTLLPGLLPVAAALIACFLFTVSVNIDSWLLIGIGSAIALGVYLAVLLLFCLDSTDRELVDRVVRKVKGTFERSSTLPEIPRNPRV